MITTIECPHCGAGIRLEATEPVRGTLVRGLEEIYDPFPVSHPPLPVERKGCTKDCDPSTCECNG
jgi:hypothetical protein